MRECPGVQVSRGAAERLRGEEAASPQVVLAQDWDSPDPPLQAGGSPAPAVVKRSRSSPRVSSILKALPGPPSAIPRARALDPRKVTISQTGG